MNRPSFCSLTVCAMAALGAGAAQGQRWQQQYFYDQGKSTLVFQDIQSLSPRQCIAVGNIVEKSSRKPVSIVTKDGGEHWDLVPIEENPVSLFFLNDSLGWMVTEKGVWKTTEAGRDWKKLPHLPAQAFRVYFADENLGWAACTKKTVLVTRDGGKKWEPVAAASTLPGVPDRSGYNWISFANPSYGIITGFNQPLQRWAPMFPTWLDPEEALTRRESPHMTYALVTNDAGKTWKTESASLLGHVTRLRLTPDGLGLGLIEYNDSFKYPSEAYQIDWKTGKNVTVFRDKRQGISDIWLTPHGVAYLAGVEFAGEVRSVSPGKVKVFRSDDMKSWTEMEVDYRAVAQRVLLSGSGEDDLWMAADNGMILKSR